MIEISNHDIDKKVTLFRVSCENFNLALRNTKLKISEIQKKLKKAELDDLAELAELEGKCENLPSEELRKITELLEADEEADKGNAKYLISFYSGTNGTLHESRKKELLRRKTELEAIVRYCPTTEAERRISQLRLKRYRISDADRKELYFLKNELEEKRKKLRTAGVKLSDSLNGLAKSAKKIRAETIETETYKNLDEFANNAYKDILTLSRDVARE